MQSPSDLNSLMIFKVVANFSYAEDPTADLFYKIRVQTANGDVLCPTQEGTLRAGESFVAFNCVTSVIAYAARIEVFLSADSKQKTYEYFF